MERQLSPLRVVLGGLLITAGSLLLISRFQLLGFAFDVDLWDLWPLVLIGLGISSFTRREWGPGLALVGVGGVFLAARILPGFHPGEVWQYWPIALVFVGISMVMRSIAPSKARKRSSGTGGTAFLRTVEDAPETLAPTGVHLAAITGGYTLDLAHTQLPPEGAVVDVFAIWGSIEVIVPRHLAVDLRVMPLMGGAEDKSEAPPALDSSPPTLVIRGFVWMAGIEIKN